MGALRHPRECRCPGPFPTDYAWQMLNPTAESSVGATQASEVPMGRYGEIAELANLMLMLQSDGCDYITGETICIDGGHHWRRLHVRRPDQTAGRGLEEHPRSQPEREQGQQGRAQRVNRQGEN